MNINYKSKWMVSLYIISAILISLIIFPRHSGVDLDIQQTTFDEAIELAANQHIPYNLNPDCEPIVKTQEEKSEKVIVLFHGYTNCPAQYSILADELFEAGYNVYAPVSPYHGNINRLTDIHKHITTEVLITHVEDSLSIASGLGDEITTLGISGGAILTSISTQSKLVQESVVIAPSYIPIGVPGIFNKAVPNILGILPNINKFWSKPGALVPNSGPEYAYKQYTTKGLQAYNNLGLKLFNSDTDGNDRMIHLILNHNDEGINNNYAQHVINSYGDKNNFDINIEYIPEEWELKHDTIDPQQTFAKPEKIYPYIIDLLE